METPKKKSEKELVEQFLTLRSQEEQNEFEDNAKIAIGIVALLKGCTTERASSILFMVQTALSKDSVILGESIYLQKLSELV